MQFNLQRIYPYNVILSYKISKILTKFQHKFRIRSLYRLKRIYCLNNNFLFKKPSYYTIRQYSHKKNILRYLYKL